MVAGVIPGEVDTNMQLTLRTADFSLKDFFQKNYNDKILIAPQVTAKFISYLLCDMLAEDFNSSETPFSIYDMKLQERWR